MGKEWKDSGHRQAEVSIGPGKCDFTVQADLHRGSSIPAHISIPSVEHTGKQLLTMFIVFFLYYTCSNLWMYEPSLICVSVAENPLLSKRLRSTAAGGFNLSWSKESAATCGYTVEWCILGNTVPCPLEWMQVPEGKNTLFLPVGLFLFYCFP